MPLPGLELPHRLVWFSQRKFLSVSCFYFKPLNAQGEVTGLPSGTAGGSPEGVCLLKGCDFPFWLQHHRVVLALWVLYESSTNESGRKDVLMEDSWSLSSHNFHSFWLSYNIFKRVLWCSKKLEAHLPEALNNCYLASPPLEAIEVQDLRASGTGVQLLPPEQVTLPCIVSSVWCINSWGLQRSVLKLTLHLHCCGWIVTVTGLITKSLILCFQYNCWHSTLEGTAVE